MGQAADWSESERVLLVGRVWTSLIPHISSRQRERRVSFGDRLSLLLDVRLLLEYLQGHHPGCLSLTCVATAWKGEWPGPSPIIDGAGFAAGCAFAPSAGF